jgi:hypothetical protein
MEKELSIIEKKHEFFTSLGYRPSGFGGRWRNGNTTMVIRFYDFETVFEIIEPNDDKLNENLELYKSKFGSIRIITNVQ